MGHRASLEQYDENNRKWIFLEADWGIYIYSVVDTLIFNVLCCTNANEAYMGMTHFYNLIVV